MDRHSDRQIGRKKALNSASNTENTEKRMWAYVHVKRAEESHDGQMAPTPKRERHLDLWSSIFQAIWPGPPIISAVGRSPAVSRVFSCLLFIFLTAEIISSLNRRRAPCPGWPAVDIHTCRSAVVNRATVRHAITDSSLLVSLVTVRFRPEMIGNLAVATNSSISVSTFKFKNFDLSCRI